MNKLENYKIFDIHTHIMNNVDDGSKSIEETINILKEARKAGVTDIILTPHHYKTVFENSKSLLLEKYKELVNVIEREYLDINLYYGNEVYIFPEMDKELDKYFTLADSKYILLETSFEVHQLYLENEILKLIELGYHPIIAHVERYKFVQNDIDLVDKFIEMGAKIQSNYASIIGYYGKGAQKTVKKLLKKEKIDYLASDVHHEQTIYTCMPEILKKLQKVVSIEYLEELMYLNAEKILKNRNIVNNLD